MIKNKKKKGTIQFAVQPEHKTKKVFLAGTFNDWTPERMTKRKGGMYVSNRKLEPGDYRYKFVIDGQWMSDNDNPIQVPNPFGSTDSIVHVKA